MAATNSTGAPVRADHLSAVMSPADVAAHRAASYVRSTPTAQVDGPDVDDAAVLWLTTEVAYLEREQQLGRRVAAEIQMGAAA
jgi:hypothetical protein